MNRKERLAILELELKELSNLVSAMKQIDVVPSVLIDMACEKSVRLHDGIKNINESVAEARTAHVGEPSVKEVKPEPVKEPIKEPVKEQVKEPVKETAEPAIKPVSESAKPEQTKSESAKPESDKQKVKISFFGSFPSFRPKKQAEEVKTESIIENEAGEDALEPEQTVKSERSISDVPSEMDLEQVVKQEEETKVGFRESEDDSDFQERVLDYEESQNDIKDLDDEAAEIRNSLCESLADDELDEDAPFSVSQENAEHPANAQIEVAEVDKKDYEDYDDTILSADSEVKNVSEDSSEEEAENAENVASSHQSVQREPKAESVAMELDESKVEIERPYFEKLNQSYSDTNVSVTDHGDIRRLMTINDRFLFLRELFKGDIGMLNHTLNMLNRMSSHTEAVAYMQKEFDWKKDAPGVESFFLMIERQDRKSVV